MNARDESGPLQLTYNPRTGAYHVHLDWDGDDSVVETVLRSVAAVKDLEPTELDSPYEHVDTDALNTLFASTTGGRTRESGYVSITLHDCTVVLHAHGEAEVYPPKMAASDEGPGAIGRGG